MICRWYTLRLSARRYLSGSTKGGEIRGKLNGIGFAQPLTMEVDSSQHLVIRDVSLQGSRLALPGSALLDSVPEEIKQQLDALDDRMAPAAHPL